MMQNVRSPEERRLVILRGMGKDQTSPEIAAEMGVSLGIVLNDIRAMKYHRDLEFRKVCIDQELRKTASRRVMSNAGDEKFKVMTGKTFLEKNFENMVSYYRPELIKVLESNDEGAAIVGLPRNVQRVLSRNEITCGLRDRRRVSPKAREYLPHGAGA
jgi:hypothetical protein